MENLVIEIIGFLRFSFAKNIRTRVAARGSARAESGLGFAKQSEPGVVLLRKTKE